MTHTVVLADVEYAERLLDAGCEDSAIIACLCWRGVGEAEAANLVDDLRHKRPVRILQALPLKPYKNCPSRPFKESHGQRKEEDRSRSHRRRSVWHHLVVGMRFAISGMACLCILAAFTYVGLTAWSAARTRAEAFKQRYPNYHGRVQRYQAGLPDTLYDFGDPKPAQSGGSSGSSLLQGLPKSSGPVTPTSSPL